MQNKWTIGWGLTARCDRDFCYSKNNRKYTENKDVDLGNALSFIHKNRKHITSINFETGESFIMPGFPEFLKNCKEAAPKLNLAVTTNGAILGLILPSFLKFFTDASENDLFDIRTDLIYQKEIVKIWMY